MQMKALPWKSDAIMRRYYSVAKELVRDGTTHVVSHASAQLGGEQLICENISPVVWCSDSAYPALGVMPTKVDDDALPLRTNALDLIVLPFVLHGLNDSVLLWHEVSRVLSPGENKMPSHKADTTENEAKTPLAHNVAEQDPEASAAHVANATKGDQDEVDSATPTEDNTVNADGKIAAKSETVKADGAGGEIAAESETVDAGGDKAANTVENPDQIAANGVNDSEPTEAPAKPTTAENPADNKISSDQLELMREYIAKNDRNTAIETLRHCLSHRFAKNESNIITTTPYVNQEEMITGNAYEDLGEEISSALTENKTIKTTEVTAVMDGLKVEPSEAAPSEIVPIQEIISALLEKNGMPNVSGRDPKLGFLALTLISETDVEKVNANSLFAGINRTHQVARSVIKPIAQAINRLADNDDCADPTNATEYNNAVHALVEKISPMFEQVSGFLCAHGYPVTSTLKPSAQDTVLSLAKFTGIVVSSERPMKVEDKQAQGNLLTQIALNLIRALPTDKVKAESASDRNSSWTTMATTKKDDGKTNTPSIGYLLFSKRASDIQHTLKQANNDMKANGNITVESYSSLKELLSHVIDLNERSEEQQASQTSLASAGM